ncbi:hypothetical protein C8R44DRAFT_601711, partial [Mycena epipterygia]
MGYTGWLLRRSAAFGEFILASDSDRSLARTISAALRIESSSLHIRHARSPRRVDLAPRASRTPRCLGLDLLEDTRHLDGRQRTRKRTQASAARGATRGHRHWWVSSSSSIYGRRLIGWLENFLPKIDGSTITLSHLLQHLQRSGVPTMLFGPESGMAEYAGCKLFGTFGVPLRVYPGLKINFISPAFLAALRAFTPTVIHLVDPIWLGVQSLLALHILFPATPIITSHHTNLPTYAAVFGYPYFHHRTWAVHAFLHSFARCTLVPSESTRGLLGAKGWQNLRVVGRGVEEGAFDPALRSPTLRRSWGASPSTIVILSVGRLSPEKNLPLLIHAYALLPPAVRAHTKLVFVGDGPYREELRLLCKEGEVVWMGQLTGRRLGEAVASGDLLSSPSITETFGQVTLQGLASGLPVVGLWVEGTADLVAHGRTGLLLDVER